MKSSHLDLEYINFIKNYEVQKQKARDEPPSMFEKPRNFSLKLIAILLRKNLTNILLPIYMHEPLSFIQRNIGEGLKYAYLLDKAANQNNVVDRLAYLSAFVVSSANNLCFGRTFKPFNSVLGETYEYITPTDKIILISEKVSNNPQIYAGHAQTDKWEFNINVTTRIINKLTKIKFILDTRIQYRFKKDNQYFISNRPDYYIHEHTTEHQWHEYQGNQIIIHTDSPSRSELIYHGCEKYSDKDCIDGKIYDKDNKSVGILQGHYLYHLKYMKFINHETTELWNVERDDEVFISYFSFRKFTLGLNDPNYDVKCPTDSRKRMDIKSLERGDYENAEQYRSQIENNQQENEELLKKAQQEYKPRWFKAMYNEQLNKIEYIYNYEYLTAKWKNEYSGSLKIF